MTAVRSNPILSNASLRTVMLVCVVAVIIGVSLIERDPALSPQLPTMAETPVTLSDGRELWVQQHEVTVEEWNRCFEQNGCQLYLRGRADLDNSKTPATGLSYVDVNEYLVWINQETGKEFRLPTLTEWEEMAKPVLPEEAGPIFTDPALSWASTYLTEGLAPRALKHQGSFSVSPEGIADLDGSVWEWTQACYTGDNDEVDAARCPAFFVGGEHISAMSFLIRDPARGGCAVGSPPAHLGMRLVIERYE